jgi:hypothetical protein
VTLNIVAAAKRGLTKKMGRGQQKGTVKTMNRTKFIAAAGDVRLKQELKKTPTAETSTALLKTSRANGKIAAGWIQPAKLNTIT